MTSDSFREIWPQNSPWPIIPTAEHCSLSSLSRFIHGKSSPPCKGVCRISLPWLTQEERHQTFRDGIRSQIWVWGFRTLLLSTWETQDAAILNHLVTTLVIWRKLSVCQRHPKVPQCQDLTGWDRLDKWSIRSLFTGLTPFLVFLFFPNIMFLLILGDFHIISPSHPLPCLSMSPTT